MELLFWFIFLKFASFNLNFILPVFVIPKFLQLLRFITYLLNLSL